MQMTAKRLGRELIEIEADLDKKFQTKELKSKTLQDVVGRSSQKYGELRFSHLVAHLETAAVLSEEQVKKYTQFRGYSSGDSCKNIPQEHSAKMWKKHHDCK